jgi:DNA-binding LytR/AlgR family response regulator
MKVLIIEDEPLAQQELRRLLTKCAPEVEVTACLDSVEDSVEWLSNTPEPPDLIFLDIQLSDGSSFDIFEQITVAVPVIFTTAYNEYALQAFRVNSIDYLLKPIEEEALGAALQKLSSLKDQFGGKKNAALSTQQLNSLLRQPRADYKTRFLTTLGDRIRYVPVEQIAYFFAEDNTVYLVTQDRKKYVLDYTLDHLETLVDPKLFFRITRKYLTHIAAIGEVSRYFNSRLKVSLVPATDDEILISRVRVPGFLAWMGA